MSYPRKSANRICLLAAVAILFCASSQAMMPRPLLIANSDLEGGPLIDLPHQNGKGAFANVFYGTCCGRPVAIKQFHLRSLPPHLASEFDPYNKIIRENGHVNILEFFGVCDQPDRFAMVVAFMPFSLRKFYNDYSLSNENIYNFGEQIATGLAYLHSKGVAHKNLKSNNVLLTESLVIKITDYGMFFIKLESSSNGAATAEATVRWRAPETFMREFAELRYNFDAQKAVDVYAFALVLWEMKKREIPFEEHGEHKVVQLLNGGSRVELEWIWPEHFRTLMSSCWSFIPSSRPTADQILERFKAKEFDLENAKKAPVEGYKQGPKEDFGVVCEGKIVTIPHAIFIQCSYFATRKGSAVTLPNDFKADGIELVCKVGLLEKNKWREEFFKLDGEKTLPLLVNTACLLEFNSLYNAACQFVADKCKNIKPDSVIKKRLLPTAEEEAADLEFEQFLLAAIRAKHAEDK